MPVGQNRDRNIAFMLEANFGTPKSGKYTHNKKHTNFFQELNEAIDAMSAPTKMWRCLVAGFQRIIGY
jgi:hypothetical protein